MVKFILLVCPAKHETLHGSIMTTKTATLSIFTTIIAIYDDYPGMTMTKLLDWNEMKCSAIVPLF